VAGFVYIIESGGLVKIGSARDLKRRLSQLRTGSSQELELLNGWLLDFPQDTERLLHKKYAAHRVRGEWFRLPPGERAFLCDTDDIEFYTQQDAFDPWSFPPETRTADYLRECDRIDRELAYQLHERKANHRLVLCLPEDFRARMFSKVGAASAPRGEET
jgi:hypothetical protein